VLPPPPPPLPPCSRAARLCRAFATASPNAQSQQQHNTTTSLPRIISTMLRTPPKGNKVDGTNDASTNQKCQKTTINAKGQQALDDTSSKTGAKLSTMLTTSRRHVMLMPTVRAMHSPMNNKQTCSTKELQTVMKATL
jgi:hypothetical protein